jgi:hypothetical protein
VLLYCRKAPAKKKLGGVKSKKKKTKAEVKLTVVLTLGGALCWRGDAASVGGRLPGQGFAPNFVVTTDWMSALKTPARCVAGGAAMGPTHLMLMGDRAYTYVRAAYYWFKISNRQPIFLNFLQRPRTVGEPWRPAGFNPLFKFNSLSF